MSEAERSAAALEAREVDEHLRHHLADGHWHDRCGFCAHRRVHGGTGVPEAQAERSRTWLREQYEQAVERATSPGATQVTAHPVASLAWTRDGLAAFLAAVAKVPPLGYVAGELGADSGPVGEEVSGWSADRRAEVEENFRERTNEWWLR